MTTANKPEHKFSLKGTRDAMHTEITSAIRLNLYDLKFMNNIYQKYIIQGKPLSRNQNELYEKIIRKYRKQFRKLGINYRDVLERKWTAGILDPEVLELQNSLELIEENSKWFMKLSFNFNKKQIEEVRALAYDDKKMYLKKGADDSMGMMGIKYNFEWNKKEKFWYGPFEIHLFRELYYFAKKHKMHINEAGVNLVRRLSSLGPRRNWTPHVHIVHGTMYVNMIEESMLPYLEEIDMTDISIQNIERLTVLGLECPDEFDYIAEYINSLSGKIQHRIDDIKGIEVLHRYIKESKRKIVFFTNRWQNDMKSGLWSDLTGPSSIDDWSRYVVFIDADGQHDVDKLLNSGYNTLITTMPCDNLLKVQNRIGKLAVTADKTIFITINGYSNNNNKR